MLAMSTKNKPSRAMTSAEVTRMMLPPAGHVEVRERQNGSWSVFYPDPGFIPCSPVCNLNKVLRNHKHDYEQTWIESTYKPTSYQDALDWARYLSDGREVKVVAFVPLAERRAAKKAKSEA